jgi:hypothetical protein
VTFPAGCANGGFTEVIAIHGRCRTPAGWAAAPGLAAAPALVGPAVDAAAGTARSPAIPAARASETSRRHRRGQKLNRRPGTGAIK